MLSSFSNFSIDEIIVERSDLEGEGFFADKTEIADPDITELENGNILVVFRVDSGTLDVIDEGNFGNPARALKGKIFAPDGSLVQDTFDIGTLSDDNDQSNADLSRPRMVASS